MNHHHNENMPPWARKVDSYSWRQRHKVKSFSTRRGEYLVGIIANLFFLWVVNKIPGWHLDFIRDNYGAVLWILNVNLLVQIGGNSLMFLFDYAAVRHLSHMLMEASGFISLIVLYYIYPFDFRNVHGLAWFDWFLPIVFIIGMVVSALKVISNLWKLIFWQS